MGYDCYARENAPQLQRITKPAGALFTLAEAQAHSNIPACIGDDDLVDFLREAVSAELDGPDGWLGRALLPQSYRMLLDRFPYGDRAIRLPLTSEQDASTQPVYSVRYLDTSGTVQQLTTFVTSATADPVEIRPAAGTCWPCTRSQPLAVEVLYSAGYADLPKAIVQYARVRFGQLYEFRELVVSGTIIAEVPYMKRALDPYRAYWWLL
jgi:hypothetical protein